MEERNSDKFILPTFFLCLLFGLFGAHRFYVGKIATGVLQLITLGGLGIWALIDLVMIICGLFTDRDGNPITKWTGEQLVVDDTRLIQEIHNGLSRMEERVESLETILLDREQNNQERKKKHETTE
jgi:TM2 domain-containing membrane protein YozV